MTGNTHSAATRDRDARLIVHLRLHTPRRLGVGLLLVGVTVSGCSAQLVAPYNASIDSQAQALEEDFLKFASERQTNSTVPAGAYVNYIKTYSDFSALLAVMSLRAAGDPGGVACLTALREATSLGNQVALASATAAMPADSGQSCISLEVASVQGQFVKLQHQDVLRCTTPGPACATLFPPGTLADFLPNNNSGKAPFVRGVVVALESLVGFEQDLKPRTKG